MTNSLILIYIPVPFINPAEEQSFLVENPVDGGILLKIKMLELSSSNLGDVEIDLLRKRLKETEATMERIISAMGSSPDRLSPSILAQVLKAQGVCLCVSLN